MISFVSLLAVDTALRGFCAENRKGLFFVRTEQRRD